jgi:ethanolamine ammonia-lyase small subunit
MAVAGNADPMLGYLTTAFSQHPALRRDNAANIVRAMDMQLEAISGQALSSPRSGSAEPDYREQVASLYARYAVAGGDFRGESTLNAEAHRRMAALRERGLDIAGGAASGYARVDAIYAHARRALYAELEEWVLRDACGPHVGVSSRAADRDDYIAHPPAGERLRDQDVAALMKSGFRKSGVQIVVSDGLNADAINQQLRGLLPPLRQLLANDGHDVAGTTVVVRNGRVRAGYHVAQTLDPDVLIHVIGERPGTGLNTASAYLTYGRDAAGRSRWDPQLDHACTTAVCGIHPKGKPPEAAAVEIARAVRRMREQRRSGVALT